MTFNLYFLHLLNHVLTEIRERIEDLRGRRTEMLDSQYGDFSDSDYADYLDLGSDIRDEMKKEELFMGLSSKLMSMTYDLPRSSDGDEFQELLKEHPEAIRDLFDFARDEDWTNSVEAEIVRHADKALLDRGLEELKRLVREI